MTSIRYGARGHAMLARSRYGSGVHPSPQAHRQIGWRRPARHKEYSVAKRGEHT